MNAWEWIWGGGPETPGGTKPLLFDTIDATRQGPGGQKAEVELTLVCCLNR
jgi:hypothetical protein